MDDIDGGGGADVDADAEGKSAMKATSHPRKRNATKTKRGKRVTGLPLAESTITHVAASLRNHRPLDRMIRGKTMAEIIVGGSTGSDAAKELCRLTAAMIPASGHSWTRPGTTVAAAAAAATSSCPESGGAATDSDEGFTTVLRRRARRPPVPTPVPENTYVFCLGTQTIDLPVKEMKEFSQRPEHKRWAKLTCDGCGQRGHVCSACPMRQLFRRDLIVEPPPATTHARTQRQSSFRRDSPASTTSSWRRGGVGVGTNSGSGSGSGGSKGNGNHRFRAW